MALDTVNGLVAEARVLLQDQVVPYRYPDADLIAALNNATLEARRLRPDLFMASGFTLPTFAAGQAFTIEPMYRPAFLHFVVGFAQLRDAEADVDERASALMNSFIGKLVTNAA